MGLENLLFVRSNSGGLEGISSRFKNLKSSSFDSVRRTLVDLELQVEISPENKLRSCEHSNDGPSNFG